MKLQRMIRYACLQNSRRAERKRKRDIQREFEMRIDVRLIGSELFVCFDGLALVECRTVHYACEMRDTIRHNAIMAAVRMRQRPNSHRLNHGSTR